MVFDCKFIETSASLQLNVTELFEGVVRQIRLRRDGGPALNLQHSPFKNRQSITQKARRFLDRLVVCNNQRMSLKACSKSCHDLSVLWIHVSHIWKMNQGWFSFCDLVAVHRGNSPLSELKMSIINVHILYLQNAPFTFDFMNHFPSSTVNL